MSQICDLCHGVGHKTPPSGKYEDCPGTTDGQAKIRREAREAAVHKDCRARAPQEAGEARADADVIDAINEEIAEDKRMADKLPWHKGYRAGLRFAAAAIRAEKEK